MLPIIVRLVKSYKYIEGGGGASGFVVLTSIAFWPGGLFAPSWWPLLRVGPASRARLAPFGGCRHPFAGVSSIRHAAVAALATLGT